MKITKLPDHVYNGLLFLRQRMDAHSLSLSIINVYNTQVNQCLGEQPLGNFPKQNQNALVCFQCLHNTITTPFGTSVEDLA